MNRAVMVMSTQGKPRLTRFYDCQSPEKQQELIRSVYGVLCGRAENVSNFVLTDAIFGPDTHMVYKHYATLYFVFVFDSSENELAMLDLIQVFVETLDKCFKNACELDIVFNFNKMHTILDEIVLGGQVLETSSDEVLKAVEEITKSLPSSTHTHGMQSVYYLLLIQDLCATPWLEDFISTSQAGWRSPRVQLAPFQSLSLGSLPVNLFK